MYVVISEGITPDPSKVAAVVNYPVPGNQKALRSFVGRASYYRSFIPSFSKVAAPLFQLMKKDAPFEWSQDCQPAFDLLKWALTQAPVLAFPAGNGCIKGWVGCSTGTEAGKWNCATDSVCQLYIVGP